ncbi:aminoglycoside 3'-phosphotransferase [Schumannella luteola]|nr:aminoglycoside 3'-phosphotransferase [Schumannella luteola]
MPIASAPDGPVEVPDAVRTRVHAPRAVWRNMVGGLTFHDAAGARYLKWNPAGSGASLSAERDRLTWAIRFHPVPEVLEYASDGAGELLVTRELPGSGAVTPRWLGEPRTAVRAIGEGLRALHEHLPAAECPFDWSVAARTAGHELPALGDPPPIDELVVCQGDPCAPNTIIGADGRWTGHVDLAALGLADRWADLAVASMSLGWNYGDSWEPEFFVAYGIAPDPERIAYYRALWDAT